MPMELYTILPNSPLPKSGPDEVGNKAWNLMRMAARGLPVPAAFVLPTSWCRRFQTVMDDDDLARVLSSGIATLETATGLGFGSPRRPLLVSVRSGAAVSMPGMMETVLNIGLNGETVQGLIALTGNPRLAWDCYRRLIQGYAEVVQRLPREPFDKLLNDALARAGVEAEHDLDFMTLRQLAHDALDLFHQHAGAPFPQDPYEQLRHAAVAVFRSWDAPKAVTYRRANRIESNGGSAVTVQRMVFGNASGASGAGVAFTRNPANGAPELYLDFAFNAQGEDVVAGRRVGGGDQRLRRTLPAVWARLDEMAHTLESLFRDAQDFEFTVQSGGLYLLQSRTAKRTAWAALRIAVDQVDEGLIGPREALARLGTIDLASVVRTRFEDSAARPLAHAQVASIGVATGAIALDSETANRLVQEGKPVILVRPETETTDIAGMMAAAGILTARGGRTSHAAVVARQLGKVCLVGCTDLEIDFNRRSCRIGSSTIREGDFLSLDANEGNVYSGRRVIIAERPERELKKIASWQAAAPTKTVSTPL